MGTLKKKDKSTYNNVTTTTPNRNPADVASGINAGKIGMNREAQKTATQNEKDYFQRTGKSPAMARALEATNPPIPTPTPEDVEYFQKTGKIRPIEQTNNPSIHPILQTPPSPILGGNLHLAQQTPQEPIINDQMLKTEMLNTDLLSLETQTENPTAPEHFGRDVAIGTAIGAGAIAAGTAVPIIAADFLGATATTKASQEIMRSASGKLPIITERVGGIAKNTFTAQKTSEFLSGIVKEVKAPAFIIGTIMSALGSYPFAGFIKEEALQTVGFATSTAIKNKDEEGARKALELEKQILNPEVWGKIFASIPYATLVLQLKNFYSAATLKMENDEKEIAALGKEKEEMLNATVQKNQTKDTPKNETDKRKGTPTLAEIEAERFRKNFPGFQN